MVEKDKKYGIVYTLCVVVASISLITVILLVVFFASEVDDLGQNTFILVTIILGILIFFSLLFAFASLGGYLKTPNILVSLEGESLKITPTKSINDLVKIKDIKDIVLELRRFARSTRVIKIVCENKEYILEDVKEVEEAHERLLSLLKSNQ